MEKLLLTIDVGTTAIKYHVYSEHDELFKKASRIETYQEKDIITQSPKLILKQLKNDILEIACLFPNIMEIGLSTAMHSLIPVEKNREVDIMYLWSDNQAKRVIEAFKKDQEKCQMLYQKTGTPIHAMSPFAKLFYFKEEKLEWYREVNKWVDLKAYLVNYFTGEYYVDYSIASATGLFNSQEMTWDQEILTLLELKVNQLPFLLHPKEKLNINQSILLELGLNQATVLRIGASDGCLAAIGSYLAIESTLSLTLGTSGAVRLLSDYRLLSSNGKTFCYYLDDDKWVVGGPSNNGGKVLEWLSQLFYDNPVSLFETLSTSIQTEDLLFLPYLQGERAPLWDSNQTGTFYGLNITHQRKDLTQAVIEGVLFNLYYIYQQLDALKTDLLVLSGGAFKNTVIAQMTATIFNKKCFISEETEPSQGLKNYCFPVSTNNQIEGTYYLPESEKREYYQKKYVLFEKKVTALISDNAVN